MNQKRRLWKQIIILTLVLISLCLLFLFVVFPLLVRITGTSNTARNQIIEQKLAPQTPIFESFPNTTNNNDLTISGFAKNNAVVKIVFNGEELDDVVVSSDGRFQTRLPLTEGDNSFYAYVIDEDGIESPDSNRNMITLDTTNPTLTFDPEPSNSIVGKNNRNLTITGETEPGSKIYVNGTLGSVDENGHFTLTFYLNDGDNELTVETVDKAGNSEQTTLQINFQP